MATLSVPPQDLLSASVPLGSPYMHPPLSSHGSHQQPRAMSPHRFTASNLPPTTLPRSPKCPGPMSPPMSARSVGTFIDSEPSTPAYSPRIDQAAWDSSTVVVMRPMSSSSEPPTPTEPSWDMVAPAKAPLHDPTIMSRAEVARPSQKRMPTMSSQLVHPPRPPRAIKRPQDIHVVNLNQRNDDSPQVTNIDEYDKPKSKENGSLSPIAPLGKLASKMKLMLRRKNTNEKKKEKKKREWEDVDRLEDVHWTEM